MAHEAELLECYAKLRAVLVATYYVQFHLLDKCSSTKKKNVSGESLETFQCQ